MVSAAFDRNVYSQYLGSVTVVYAQASSAKTAIKQYNGAQLDDRVMKIEYASRYPENLSPQKVPLSRPQGGLPPRDNQPLPKRKGPNAIQKNNNNN